MKRDGERESGLADCWDDEMGLSRRFGGDERD